MTELFKPEETQSAAPAAKLERAPDPEQFFRVHCPCAGGGTVYLRHYERVRCECGRVYWALKPKRNEPMKLFPWPGDPNTLAPAPSNR